MDFEVIKPIFVYTPSLSLFESISYFILTSSGSAFSY